MHVKCKSPRTSPDRREAGLARQRPLAQALVLALCVSAAGPLALLLLLRLGAELLSVRLAVLVDQSDLWRERRRAGRCLSVRSRLPRFGLLVLVLGRQSQNYVSVQDAQRHAGHRVFEVVLRGEALVQAGV